MGDRAIQEAIAIGKRNAEIITLIQNWCAHARIVQQGGVGLVEQMYGLPVGMRSISCIHARASGWAGMDLANIALDFHDRNCVGCPHREPVRLPNLTDLLRERDRARERVDADRQQAEKLHNIRLEERASRRNSLRRAGDHVRSSLLDLIDSFDRDPSEANLLSLKESSRAMPASFDADIQEALFALVDGGGWGRSDGALQLLATPPRQMGATCERYSPRPLPPNDLDGGVGAGMKVTLNGGGRGGQFGDWQEGRRGRGPFGPGKSGEVQEERG